MVNSPCSPALSRSPVTIASQDAEFVTLLGAKSVPSPPLAISEPQLSNPLGSRVDARAIRKLGLHDSTGIKVFDPSHIKAVKKGDFITTREVLEEMGLGHMIPSCSVIEDTNIDYFNNHPKGNLGNVPKCNDMS